MFIGKLFKIIRFEWWLLILAIASVIFFGANGDNRFSSISPSTIYNFDLSMTFEPGNKDIFVSTYLPENSARQILLKETIDAEKMELNKQQSSSGMVARWTGNQQATNIQYRAQIKTQAIKYELSEDSEIPLRHDESFADYLKQTETIAVQHPEIQDLWQRIKPENTNRAIDSLYVIYNYTRALETLPFKGTTSSLTALRLGAASCNGKSRLFVSLARNLGLPARLVGGVILDQGKKRTSHQWVEVNLLGQWVPFDPTNDHFAELPAHYLELYRGDMSLFRHTSNIHFDYQFNTSEQRISSAYYTDISTSQSSTFNLVKLFEPFGMPPKTISTFLLFPLCALLITFFRNVIGIQTFGIFVPMLIAMTCNYTGLIAGITGVAITIVLAFIILILFEKARLLKVPRLAAAITMITLFVLLFFYTVEINHPINLGVFALFPIVIISFIAEKLLQLSGERDWKGMAIRSIGTVAVVSICYFFLQSIYIQSLFAFYPEALLMVLALQIYIGRWNGIRFNELFRFRQLFKNKEPVVGINQRNRELVYQLNEPEGLLLAADKLKTKSRLASFGLPVPATLFQCSAHSELESMKAVITQYDEFVVKPNMGSQGNGIVVIVAQDDNGFRTAGGEHWKHQELIDHMSDIVSGSYSQQGEADIGYLEPLIKQHDLLEEIAPGGLADIRLITVEETVIAAMLRLPTKKSNGKANLHQGAIGISVDVATGRLGRANWHGKSLASHPDTKVHFSGITLPYWQQIIQIGERCAKAMPLGYMGIDICIDHKQGPLILEVNGRPGLEIQNIQGHSLIENLKLVPAEHL